MTLTTIDLGDSFWAEINETLFAMDCMNSYGFSKFILEGDVQWMREMVSTGPLWEKLILVVFEIWQLSPPKCMWQRLKR